MNLGFVRQPVVANTTHGDQAKRMWSQIVTTSAEPCPDSSHTVMSGCWLKPLTSQFVISAMTKPPIGFL